MAAAFSWILSVLGIAIAYIFLLGAAMSTVPQKLTLPTALGLAILPTIVLVGVILVLWKGSQPVGKNILLHGIPFVLAVVTLIMLGGSVKFPQAGGPYNEVFGKDTDQPRYRLEIRPASLEPKDGYSEMTAKHGDPLKVYVSEEILFTHTDLISTSISREDRNSPTTLILAFHGGAQPRLQEVSRAMQGEYWALLLEGELWMSCRLVEPLERELAIGAELDPKEAARLARGIVQDRD